MKSNATAYLLGLAVVSIASGLVGVAVGLALAWTAGW
jgi:hypothetical protein